MKYFIAGGLGFIGSNFVERLLSRPGNKIFIYDKMTYAAITPIPDDERILFMRGDICDENMVNYYMRDCHFIINFAAETHVDNSIKNQTPFLQSNFVGVGVLLNAARRYKIPMLQVSTDEVYGSLAHAFAEEDSMLNPTNPYSASKAAADSLCLAHYHTYGTKIIISRCCNNYGQHQHPEKFLPKAILNSLRGKRVPLYGSGLNQRQWIHVSDHCAALDLLVKVGQYGEVYNVGTGDICSNIEMLKMLEDFLPIVDIEYVDDRPGHDWRYALNYRKIRELGWLPEKPLINGLDETVSWYRERYENVKV